MRELIEFLKDNFFIVFAVLAYALSALGGAASRAAKRAADEKRKVAKKERMQKAVGQAPSPPAEPAQGRRPEMDAQNIAREIRRAMGLEEVEVVQAAPPPMPEPEPIPQVTIVEDAPRRGQLREELAAKALRDDERRASQISTGSAVSGRTLDQFRPHIPSSDGRARKARRPAARMVDLHRPAEAIVAMEIFGPPVALRTQRGGPIGL